MNITLDLTPYRRPYGQKRIRNAFLWFPKLIGDKLRWLERATWVEEYEYQYYSEYMDDYVYAWEGIEWIA